jgi:hypothetical protein
VPHLQSAALGDVQDCPSVAVFDPVGGSDAEPPVVSAGDDHIAGRGPVSVGQLDLPARAGVVKAAGAGTPVQLGDEVAGRGDHEAVEAAVTVGLPRAEQLLGRGGGVADVDALLIEIEAERFRSAVTKGEGGGGLCLIIKTAAVR